MSFCLELLQLLPGVVHTVQVCEAVLIAEILFCFDFDSLLLCSRSRSSCLLTISPGEADAIQPGSANVIDDLAIDNGGWTAHWNKMDLWSSEVALREEGVLRSRKELVSNHDMF
jgi:hypothetical protein